MAITVPSAHTYGAGFPVDGVPFTSAILQGWVVRNGGEACEYRFRYKVAGGSYSYTDWTGSVEGEGDGDGYFGETIVVDSKLVYYFNAQVKNTAGESSWGAERAIARPHAPQRVWYYTPKQGTAFHVANAAASPFSADIAANGGAGGNLSSTNIPFDGETNLNCLKGLRTGADRWGRFVLHNTTKTESVQIVEFDESDKHLTVEADSPDDAADWAEDDVITLQSTTCTQAGYMDVDLGDEIADTEVVIYIQFEILDKSASSVAGRRIIVHPFETYDTGKRLMCAAALASEFSVVTAIVPIVSQKVCVMFDGTTDAALQIAVLATQKYADT